VSGSKKRLNLSLWLARSILPLLALIIAPRFAVAHDLRVVTYNVWGLPSPILRHPDRFAELPNAINSLDADVVLIQEAFTKKAKALETLPKFPYVARGPSSNFLRFSSGLLILSRYPIIESSTLKYTACGGFDCYSNKGAIYARILVPGQGIISVFNTHLNANQHTDKRLLQTTELLKFVRAHSGQLPTIVGGDFNQVGQALFTQIPTAPPLRDAYREHVWKHPVAQKHQIEGYTADPVRNPYLKRSATQRRLDQIYLLDGTTVGWNVRGGGLVLDGENGKVLSDHFGIRTVVKLSDSRPPAL